MKKNGRGILLCVFLSTLWAASAQDEILLYKPDEIMAYAKSIDGELREIHRDFHRHPELGFQEVWTTARIKEILKGIEGIEIKQIPLKTGVIAELKGTRPQLGTIGLRCDIDALPITENTSHDYQSIYKGRMHACGHDGHITILLGAAKILSRFRPEHNVRFIFQPAEEIVPSGAPEMIKVGAVDALKMIWGFHLNATSDLGDVGWYDGIVMAGGYKMDIRVHGKSVHTAYPEMSVNPGVIISRIAVDVDGLKQMVRATRPYSITLMHLEAKPVSFSASPEEGRIVLATRYHEPQVNELLVNKIRQIVKMNCDLYSAKYDIEETPGLDPTYNLEAMGPIVKENAKALGLRTEHIFASMGGDDFGCYGWKVPAYYMTFGIRKGENFHIAHTSKFEWDQSVISPSAAMFASCALRREYPELKREISK